MIPSTLQSDANEKPRPDLWSAAGGALKAQGQAPAVVPVARTGSMPLSPAQERLYSLMQSGHDDSYYQVYLAWRIRGPLNTEALETSLRAIVARHEILRTTFPMVEGRPVTVIAAEANLTLERVDLTMLEEGDREGEMARLARAEVRKPFDLARGPVLRAAQYRLSATEHFLVVTICQIVFDGWSMRVFSRELGALYGACASGQPSTLPALPVQWADFVHWQRTLLDGPSLEEERSYWRRQLEAPYAGLRLPNDHPRATGETPSGLQQSWSLTKDLTDRLNGLARDEGATHFTALLAALHAWLHHLTRQEDIIVFASTFARGRPETKGLIGLFANVLPLRATLNGNPSFREVLRRVRDGCLDAFAHQTLPFEEILDALPRAARSEQTPLFQVMLIHQNAPLPEFAGEGARFIPTHEIDSGNAKFDFLWDVTETKDGLRGTFNYRSDIFETATISSLLYDFEAFLSDVAAAPDRPILELPVRTGLSASDRDGSANGEKSLAGSSPSKSSQVQPSVAPRDLLEEQLAALWERLLGRSPIGVRDDFFDLGGDSLLAVRLFAEVEQFFRRRLPLSTLYETPTIESLAGVIRQDGWMPPYSSLVPVQATGSRPPFYCVSGVGGGVLVFHDLARYLGPDQPIYALQPKPLSEGETQMTSVPEIAAHYITEIRGLQPEGPYYIGGYSFGGLVAFEIAHQLKQAGQRVALLASFDMNAPLSVAGPRGGMFTRRTLGSRRLRLLEVLRSKERSQVIRRVAERFRIRFEEKLARLLRRPLPESLSSVEGSQGYAAENYVGRPYAGRITLFRSTNRPEGEPWNHELGWDALASEGVEVLEVPGDHLSMYSPANIPVLAKKLKSCLEEAQSRNEVRAPILAGHN